MNWRRLFPIIFLFTCVDGFIGNWLYPAKLPFLYKDIFILIVYAFFSLQEYGQQWLPKFKKSIGFNIWHLAILLMLLGGFQIFNPGVPRIEVGILGFKVMFFYWPLAILAYAYVDSFERLRGLIKKIVYFSIPICLFGLYQFWRGPDYMVKTFGRGFERAIIMASIGGRERTFLRVFGTFASTGQFSCFLTINAMFIFALLFTAKNIFERRLLNGCALLNFITLLATGSRGSLAVVLITGFVFLVLCRRFWRRIVFAFVLATSLYLGFSYLGRAVVLRFETLKDREMVKLRTIGITRATFLDYLERYPFGHGLGTGTTASRHLLGKGRGGWQVKGRGLGWQLIENYPAKLQYEMGILGVIIFYLLLINLTIRWIKYWVKLIDPTIFIFSAALSSSFLIIFWTSLISVIDTPPFGIFLWAGVGMVAKLATLQSNAEPLIQEETYALR